ncbi:MAG: Prephenate dehydrogenase [Alphaproteobacteria bacterium MarineAlpha11_Bin1]|nr:MAG: Prephenate dehydrogenase [Alphaproteobacteria bacterium MarineAlpha11_Bin1]|tara:strand:+ start:1040 stop:1948 length:909 start_codon:yes stop_codon:yes gene_type:complete
MFNRVALIGIGLIGSSIARVMRRDRLAGSIIACARTDETLEAVKRLDIADDTTKNIAEAVRGADLVMICTPVSTYEEISKAMAPALMAGAIVTDVGSVKESAIKTVMPHLPDGVHFVPGHPIAGTENSGPEAGFDTLFEGRWFLITPPRGTDQTAIDKVASLWQRAGSQIDFLEPEHHDQVLAITSHLPHLIAYTIVGTATDLEEDIKSEVVKYSASGFRDFTRIAASDPVMWRDIFIANRAAVLEMLGRLSEDLAGLQRAIRIGDGETLERLFRRTQEIRRGVVKAGQHIPPAPEKSDRDT